MSVKKIDFDMITYLFSGDSAMSIIAEGYFFCGLTLYILNKIKDAKYLISGEKNNIYEE